MAESYANLLTQAMQHRDELRDRAANMKTAIAGGNISAVTLTQYYDRLDDVRLAVAPLLALPNLNELAASMLVDPPADAAALLTGIYTAGTAIKDWMEANLPRDAEGWLVFVRLDNATRRTVYRSYTAQEVSGLVPLLDDLMTAAG